MSLAEEVWLNRERPSLEDVLRADPELRERAKAIGWWLRTIEKIESDEEDS